MKRVMSLLRQPPSDLPSLPRPSLVELRPDPSAEGTESADIRRILGMGPRADAPTATNDDGHADAGVASDDRDVEAVPEELEARAREVMEGRIGSDPGQVRRLVSSSMAMLFDSFETLLPYAEAKRDEAFRLRQALNAALDEVAAMGSALDGSETRHRDRDDSDAGLAAMRDSEAEGLRRGEAEARDEVARLNLALRRSREAEQAARAEAEAANEALRRVQQVLAVVGIKGTQS